MELNQMELNQDELRAALAESLKLQSHYAALLNQYDGGRRMTFDSIEAWVERLRVCRELQSMPRKAAPQIS